MRMIELLRRELSFRLRFHAADVIIIFISLTLSLTVTFPLTAYMKAETEKLYGYAIDRATYDFQAFPQTAEDAAATVAFFNELFFSGEYPEVREMYDRPAFSVFPHSGETVFWNVFFPESSPLCRYTDWEKEKTEGSWFDDPACQGKQAAAALSIKDFPDAAVGSYVDLMGYKVEVIALMKESNVLPWDFILLASGEGRAIGIESYSALFERPLSKEETDRLASGGVVDIRCRLDLTAGSYIWGTVLILLLQGGLLLIIVLNIRNLFIHLFRQGSYHYIVMKACGGTGWQILTCLYTGPLLLSVIAFLIAAAFFIAAVNPVLKGRLLYPELTPGEFFTLFGIFILLMILFLLPAARRIMKADPAEKKAWR